MSLPVGSDPPAEEDLQVADISQQNLLGTMDHVDGDEESQEQLPQEGRANDTDTTNDWKARIEDYTKLQDAKEQQLPNDTSNKKTRKKVKKYYKKQERLVAQFLKHYNYSVSADYEDEADKEGIDNARRNNKIAEICAKVTFAANFLLFVGKLVATILSGSLAIMSSVVDSAVDLISGVVMWCTSSAMKRRDVYKYPSGKKRMEPLAILVLSIIMSMASAMVIIKSAEQIQVYATSDDPENRPKVDVVTIVLICITIVVKLSLFLWMRRYKMLSVQALSQDHRNDVVSNIAALIMGFVGSRYWSYADPLGAIVIAIYILISWCITAYEQVQMLAGKSADPDFLKKITWIAINHHPEIHKIDTVTVFHFGQNFLAEVHIVLPEDMSVRDAHDIQETLQQRIEKLEEVERAFVHIDYETEHHREEEHKVV